MANRSYSCFTDIIGTCNMIVQHVVYLFLAMYFLPQRKDQILPFLTLFLPVVDQSGNETDSHIIVRVYGLLRTIECGRDVRAT